MGPGIHIRYAKQILGGLVVFLMIVAGIVLYVDSNNAAHAPEGTAVVETVEGEETAG